MGEQVVQAAMEQKEDQAETPQGIRQVVMEALEEMGAMQGWVAAVLLVATLEKLTSYLKKKKCIY